MNRSIPRPLGTHGRRPAPVLAAFLLTAGLLAGALAGCAPASPELGTDAAKELQSQVLSVTEAAAADDSPGSLKLLDELVTKLDDAAARGEVSFKRHQSIKASIDAVRADLTAKQAAADAAKAAAQQAAAQQEAAAQAAAAAAATQAASAPAPQPAPAVVAPAPGKADKPKPKGKG